MKRRKSTTSSKKKTEKTVKMTKEEMRFRILNDPDWIYSKKNENSLEKLKAKYPDGCPDRIGASVLRLSLEDFQKEYEQIILKLRAKFGVTNNED